MASTREQRVNDALQELVSRLIPAHPDGNEADEEQRWEESIALARRMIDVNHETNATADTSQAADLIRTKLLRDTGRPDRATKFSSLYSRLLQQPVLSQKWAILYFIYKMAEPDFRQVQQQLERSGEGTYTGNRVLGGRRHERGQSNVEERLSSQDGPAQRVPTPVRDTFSRQAAGRIPRQTPPDSPLPNVRKEKLPSRPMSSRQKELPRGRDMQRPPPRPTEAQLLRDLPFTLQGLSSTHLPFEDEKTLVLPAELPIPMVGLLHILAEPALLYKSLAKFVEEDQGGLVGQALRSAISEELRSYLGLVATLEGQIRKALAQAGDNASRRELAKVGATLRKCVVWTRDATLGLRLMSMIAEESSGKKGGRLVTLLHSLSLDHGDPFVHTFAARLLHKTAMPFYTMLQHWIFAGELADPFGEFFVVESPDSEETSASSIWTDKYHMNKDLVPSIISPELAQRVFLIGKSLNFIRSSCSDSSWVESYTASSTQELSLSDPTALSNAIDKAFKATTARVLELMENKFSLFQHLSALKKYLLLGQGDFIAVLLESLSSILDGPANAQIRHHLTSALDHSIRDSNAQYEPQDITRRLDARMLELSHGEIGWDVFTLEYRMDSPLDVVVGPWAQKQYLKIFNFLWRIKRVEFTLSSVWGRCMTGSRGVLKFVNKRAHDKSGESADEALQDAWKRARGGLTAMIHFVGQLQYYILFEVIESGWEKLMAEVKNPSATLDTLITAHTAYLHNITRKGLLAPSGSSSSNASTQGSVNTIDFTSQLHGLLKSMLAYKDVVEALYSHSVAEFTRSQDRARRGDQRADYDRRGLRDADETREIPPLIQIPGEERHDDGGTGTGLSKIRKRLADIETDFTAKVNILLGDLAYQPDSDMRFLGVVMNFNDVYRPVRRRRHGHHGHGHGHGKDREREREVHSSGKAPETAGSQQRAEVQAEGGSGDA